MAKISEMVKRCRLMNPFHLWCIAFAATSQWTDVRQELLLLLERTFSGWVQSRINEKGNKAIRDAHRDNASKVNSILGSGVDAELSDGVIEWVSVGADGGADGRRRGRAGAWVTCALWAGGGRDGGHSSRVGAALSEGVSADDWGRWGRGRAGARDTFGCGFVLRGLVQGSCVTLWGGSLGGSFGGRLGTVGGGAAPVHGPPWDLGWAAGGEGREVWRIG